MLNDEILEKYIQSFFGYGNLNSDYWFVSLEEGWQQFRRRHSEKIEYLEKKRI